MAIATDRPYRQGSGVEAAFAHLEREKERQVDPRVVDALGVAVLGASHAPRRPAPTRRARAAEDTAELARNPGIRKPRRSGAADLRSAISELEVVPAFGPAVERILGGRVATGQDILAAVESDLGLTLAVLRAGNAAAPAHAIATVSDALRVLSLDAVQRLAQALPRASFPWRTAEEALLHRMRLHGQAVSRAAERIAREAGRHDHEDLVAPALLHDVGMLVLAKAQVESSKLDPRTATPEQRVRAEQRALGLDHAAVGGLLMQRWGLPAELAAMVAGHHRAEGENRAATIIRLADLFAHHVQGDSVDGKLMMRLVGACDLSARTAREVLFELPHAGGSQRRRAEPSPLSTRESEVLRRLADGQVYKQIASDLGVSASTIRSTMHNAFAKLHVTDRAHAVLRATENAWI